MRLQGCGERPRLVCQGGVDDGMLTFSTWRIDLRTAQAILHTVNAGE